VETPNSRTMSGDQSTLKKRRRFTYYMDRVHKPSNMSSAVTSLLHLLVPTGLTIGQRCCKYYQDNLTLSSSIFQSIRRPTRQDSLGYLLKIPALSPYCILVAGVVTILS
jgi:hypothetical protein